MGTRLEEALETSFYRRKDSYSLSFFEIVQSSFWNSLELTPASLARGVHVLLLSTPTRRLKGQNNRAATSGTMYNGLKTYEIFLLLRVSSR